MKIKELIKSLSKYDDETNVFLKLVPNDGSENESDENDIDINFIGEIYGGGLDSFEPFVEIGFQISK